MTPTEEECSDLMRAGRVSACCLTAANRHQQTRPEPTLLLLLRPSSSSSAENLVAPNSTQSIALFSEIDGTRFHTRPINRTYRTRISPAELLLPRNCSRKLRLSCGDSAGTDGQWPPPNYYSSRSGVECFVRTQLLSNSNCTKRFSPIR